MRGFLTLRFKDKEAAYHFAHTPRYFKMRRAAIYGLVKNRFGDFELVAAPFKTGAESMVAETDVAINVEAVDAEAFKRFKVEYEGLCQRMSGAVMPNLALHVEGVARPVSLLKTRQHRLSLTFKPSVKVDPMDSLEKVFRLSRLFRHVEWIDEEAEGESTQRFLLHFHGLWSERDYLIDCQKGLFDLRHHGDDWAAQIATINVYSMPELLPLLRRQPPARPDVVLPARIQRAFTVKSADALRRWPELRDTVLPSIFFVLFVNAKALMAERATDDIKQLGIDQSGVFAVLSFYRGNTRDDAFSVHRQSLKILSRCWVYANRFRSALSRQSYGDISQRAFAHEAELLAIDQGFNNYILAVYMGNLCQRLRLEMSRLDSKQRAVFFAWVNCEIAWSRCLYILASYDITGDFEKDFAASLLEPAKLDACEAAEDISRYAGYLDQCFSAELKAYFEGHQSALQQLSAKFLRLKDVMTQFRRRVFDSPRALGDDLCAELLKAMNACLSVLTPTSTHFSSPSKNVQYFQLAPVGESPEADRRASPLPYSS